MDWIALLCLKAFVWLIGSLPPGLAVKMLSPILRVIFWAIPKYGRIARINLEIAFPRLSPQERRRIWHESFDSVARLLVDACRMHRLSPDWVKTHVSCPLLERYREIKAKNPDTGVLLATGHLGSFELLAHSMPMFGHKIAFVVRNFQMKQVDAWWTSMRDAYGNKVINRQGAFQDVVAFLKSGVDVAILFDQNVRDRHAVFVDWFGLPAATSKTLALAALKTGACIIVASIAYHGADCYEIVAKECPVEDVYANATIPLDDKVVEITKRASLLYEQMIRERPTEWFWMHRRWRTRPAEDPRNPYEGR